MPKADVANARKSQIVQATVECISKHGYHNFSMQDVAKTAGVSKGIIHYYFLNKDELMMSVLQKVANDIETLLAEEMDAISDPKRKLEVFVQGCFDVVRSTREYYQVNMDFWTQINQKEAVREVLSKHYNNFRQTAESVIEQGIDAGVFKATNPSDYASYIIALVDGLSLQWLFDEERFDYSRISKMSLRLILDGLSV